jgi:hypothetical protein
MHRDAAGEVGLVRGRKEEKASDPVDTVPSRDSAWASIELSPDLAILVQPLLELDRCTSPRIRHLLLCFGPSEQRSLSKINSKTDENEATSIH